MNVTISDCPLCLDTTQLRIVVRFKVNDTITEEHIMPYEVTQYMSDPNKQNVQLLRVYCDKHRVVLEPLTF